MTVTAVLEARAQAGKKMSAIPLAQTAGLRTGHNGLFPPGCALFFRIIFAWRAFEAGKPITKSRFVGMVAIRQRSRPACTAYQDIEINNEKRI
jgi:hypothetical protein